MELTMIYLSQRRSFSERNLKVALLLLKEEII